MGSIAESLVATAIGLVVAIPAVAAFNYFQRRIRATLASSEALTHILLAYAKGEAAQSSGGEPSRSDARGAEAAEEAMASAAALQRMRLERRLAFLGTVGNNAPFIGLLGTVIGIVQAFEKLQGAGASGGAAGPASDVMGSISESLVATAIGLVVAIPAVAAFNYFQRRIRATLANSDALTHILLAYAKGEAAASGGERSGTVRAPSVREPSETFGMQRISTLPS